MKNKLKYTLPMNFTILIPSFRAPIRINKLLRELAKKEGTTLTFQLNEALRVWYKRQIAERLG